MKSKASCCRIIEHPILGYIVIKGGEETGITSLEFTNSEPKISNNTTDPLLTHVEDLIQQYLLGKPVGFEEIPLAPHGTPFQKSVWQTLCRIPWGATQSYKWVAAQLGKPTAYRAIGQANGKNPIPLIIPCHRVIQHNGDLGGYSGGLHIKSFLLSLESSACGHSKESSPGFHWASDTTNHSMTLL